MKKPKLKWPRLGASKLCTQWIGALLALSILARFDGGFIESRFALLPSRVWLGEIWRLVTWPFIEHGVLTLLFTCVAIYRLGNDLAYRWGEARLQRFMIHIFLGCAAATVIIAPLFGWSRVSHVGGWTVLNALTIAWARQFPTQALRVYGIDLNGRRLIQFTVAVTVLFAIFTHPLFWLPDLAACALSVYYPQRWLRR